jgi:hypothetical protein
VSSRFGLHQDHGHAVDHENHVGLYALGTVGEGEFVGDMEGISMDVILVEKRHLSLSVFALEEDRLYALQEFLGIEVAPYAGGDVG